MKTETLEKSELKYIFRFLFSLVFLLTLNAYGALSESLGGVDGGGGIGVQCGDKVSTLDLYEARNKGFHLQAGSSSLDQNLKTFGMKLSLHFARGPSGFPYPSPPDSPAFGEIMMTELKKDIVSKFQDIPAGTKLDHVYDATLPVLPASCQFVQIAFYDDVANKIYRDSEYWSKMDSLEQAALILHEFIYRRARRNGAMNSDETRKLIGRFFSDQSTEPLVSPIWNVKRKLWCGFGRLDKKSEIFDFYGIEETENKKIGTAFYFIVFKGVALTSRVRAFFPGIRLEMFRGRLQQDVSSSAIQKATSQVWKIDFFEDTSTRYSSMRASMNHENPPAISYGGCDWDAGVYDD